MKSLHIENSRPTLLLALHGFTGDAYDFSAFYEDTLIDAVWRFADLPGHLYCEQTIPANDRQWADFISRIDQVMQEAENTRARVYILAYSMGVRLLLKALLENNWKPDGLVLVGATAGLESGIEQKERLEHDRVLADKLRKVGISSFIDDWMQLPIIASQNRVSSPERIRRKKQLNAIALADALLEYSQGNMPPVWDRLGKITSRTWLIAGAQDQKYIDLHRRMVALLPNADMQVIPHAGHAPHIEQPKAFRDVLRACLGQADGEIR